MFDLGDRLLMVATDRISAFDVVLPNGIPHKGEILTRISDFWFGRTGDIIPNHRQDIGPGHWPEDVDPELLGGRAVVVHKTSPLPIECVVRGYLAGSGWKDYCREGSVCGHALPPGLQLSSRLPDPLFTPATKASTGHDQNISFEEAVRRVGEETAHRAREASLALYRRAAREARRSGMLLADTKFEFGLRQGRLMLIDEALTPDSSRYWPADGWEPGRPQDSYDKQFVRDYLEGLAWDKKPPAPMLPADIVARTRDKYIEILEILTGESFVPAGKPPPGRPDRRKPSG